MRSSMLVVSLAAILSLSLTAKADDWKDESGKGRGSGGPPPWAGRGGDDRQKEYFKKLEVRQREDGKRLAERQREDAKRQQENIREGRGFPGGYGGVPGGYGGVPDGYGQGGYPAPGGYGQGGYPAPGQGGCPAPGGYGVAPGGFNYYQPVSPSGGQIIFGGSVQFQTRRYYQSPF